MRVLVVKVPHEGGDRYTWHTAWSLPFVCVAACNYGWAGDVVTLQMIVPTTAREKQAQEIFKNKVQTIANEMHKNVHEVYVSREAVVACGTPNMTLKWVTNHTKGGATA